MRKCINCNQEIDETAKFCRICGAVQKTQSENAPDEYAGEFEPIDFVTNIAQKEKKPLSKKSRIIISAALAAAIIIVFFALKLAYSENKAMSQETALNSLTTVCEDGSETYYIFAADKEGLASRAKEHFNIDINNKTGLVNSVYTTAQERVNRAYMKTHYYTSAEKKEQFYIVTDKIGNVIQFGYKYDKDSDINTDEVTAKLLKVLSDEFINNEKILKSSIKSFSELRYNGFKSIVNFSQGNIGFGTEITDRDKDFLDSYTISTGGYRRFTVKTDSFFKNLINNAPDYGWTLNRYGQVDTATYKDRQKGISQYASYHLQNDNGNKIYLRIFYDKDSSIIQVEYYLDDTHFMSPKINEMMIFALFEDYPSDYLVNAGFVGAKANTWTQSILSEKAEYDGLAYTGWCIGVKNLEPMTPSSMFSSAKDFTKTSSGGFSFKAHISDVSWGNSKVMGNGVYMELIFSVMNSEGTYLGDVSTMVDIDSSAISDYIHYKGKNFEFVFVCDSNGNLMGLPQRV